jgi:membrane-bound lytic murein transglycosylase A
VPANLRAGLWRWQHSRSAVTQPDLEPIGFDGIAGWAEDDHAAALECYLQSASLTGMPVPGPGDVQALLKDRQKARAFFEATFAAFRIMAAPGLLTSYFEPVLKGSRTQSAAFPVPLYRRPPDLSPLLPGHPLSDRGFTAGRETPGGFEPYFTRAEIEAGALAGKGLEILFVADRLEAFVMHVQGSGRIELDDGTAVRVTFDGKNGHPYTSVAKRIVELGHLTREEADLEGMLAFLRAQPDPQTFLNENKSYIFFKELEGFPAGPRGSSGAELRPGRSLAADPLYHAPGTPIWVVAPGLDYEGAPLRRLLVAQDTGSAIAGPQRGDIFAGMGGDARRFAGRARHVCEFIVLRPRTPH